MATQLVDDRPTPSLVPAMARVADDDPAHVRFMLDLRQGVGHK
jgi:hypothetical protein